MVERSSSEGLRKGLVRHRARLGLLGVAGLLLLATGERQGCRSLAPVLNLTGGAQWIWAPDGRRATGPRAFYAVRDFELSPVPPRVDALVTADESYVLWINGQRVGSGCYQDGAPLDRYAVGPLLLPGGNRIAVELASSRGAGGLLLALTDPGSGEQLLASDGSWRVFDRAHPGILQGWLPQEEGEPVFVWGRPPTGRWGRPREVVTRPLFCQVRDGAAPRVPRRLSVGRAVRQGDPAAGQAGGWRPVGPQAMSVGVEGLRPLGPQVTFDFGAEVTGYLVLAQRRKVQQTAGLAWLGAEPPEPRPGAFDTAVVPLPGGEIWRDPLARRFRYVTVLGLDTVVGAWVEPVAQRWLAELPEPPGVPPGVFGLQPPILRTPIEDEVRRKLKSVPGVAGREDF